VLPSPWKSLLPIEAGREYLALISYLPLKRYRKIPAFVQLSRQVQRQLEATPGVIGYSLQAQILRRRFWTLSLWESEAALMEFVHHAPHSEIMRELAPHMGKTFYTTWSVKGSELPLDWEVARGRVPGERACLRAFLAPQRISSRSRAGAAGEQQSLP
jgi:heme-degrading monooxygenase HmoA